MTSFQWERCDAQGQNCSDIGGASSASYLQQAADLGHTLRARASQNGIVVGVSNAVGPVVSTPTPGGFFLTFADLGLPMTPDVTWDGNPGTFQAFLDSLDGVNKRKGGLPWGSRVPAPLTTDFHWSLTHAGTQTNPIEFFPVNLPGVYVPSANSGEPDIGGRINYYSSAAWINWIWTKFDGIHVSSAGGGNTSAHSVGGQHVTYDGCVARQSNPAHGTIMISPLDIAAPYGPGQYFTFRRGKIYDVGQWPVSSPTSPGFFMHGNYNQTLQCLYEDVWTWNCSRAGFLMRGSQQGIFRYVVADRCGIPVAFGDNGSANNDVHHGIFTNAFQAGGNDAFCVSSYQPGPGNKIHDSTAFGGQQGNISAQGVAVDLATILQIDPQYINGLPANKQGATAGTYDPSLIDYRPTAAAVVAAGHGSRSMVPYA